MSRHDPLYVSDMTHETKFLGSDIGRPAVKVSFDSEETREVGGVLNSFEAYNWTKRVSDGHSFLILQGTYPLSPKNHDALDTFLYNLNPRYCEVQCTGQYEPPREIKNYINSYLVDLNALTAETERDAIDFFLEQSRNYDACDFMVRFDGSKPTKRRIYNWKDGKKVYPHNIHLYVHENADDWRKDFEKAQTLAGQHGWNVIPPFEIAYEESEEDDENGES